MNRLSLVLAAPAALLVVGLACSYDVPEQGSMPFDGMTGVARDAVLLIDTVDPVPEGYPSLDGTVTLTRRDTGEAVPFTMQVLGDDLVAVSPDQSLEADTTYELTGFRWGALATTNAAVPPGHRPSIAFTEFTTGGRPRLLDLALAADQLTLVFSEAIDPATLREGITVTTHIAVDLQPELPWRFDDAFLEGWTHLPTITLLDPLDGDLEIHVEVNEALLTADQVPFTAGKVWIPTWQEFSNRRVDVYTGAGGFRW